ncbi:pectate lyase-like protein [Kribbella amoyensis]|uniref:Pectate lyase-like protein n=1 Tax=Kribbella amoyensis TaxID=996641 RepID=A0A561B912_9ACTN|nr:glycoside hydrolase family 28 protein [Kribbella amoyensis]TWD75182.1 pectate lyase-like protein [Kribbella amoyensis]
MSRQTAAGWDDVDRILATVRPPVFADRDFPITAYGAVGDGRTPATEAIRTAVAECAAAGGGRVVVPPGTFLTGAVHLRSGVNLHVSEGATLLFSSDPVDYLPVVRTRYEGVEVFNYSPMIYAYGCTDIAVTGTGTIDGGGDWDTWWGWFHRCDDDFVKLRQQGADGVPVDERIYGPGYHLRSSFIQPYDCVNVLIEGVKLVRSPFWQVHPVLCRNVTIRDLEIDSEGPNNDGVDLESCRSVVVRGCRITAGDDCIVVKSGREADGLRVNVPSEDIVVEDCTLTVKYGAITVGSDMTGGARNIYVRDCVIGSDRLYFGLYLKTNSIRGGFAENIYLKDLTISTLTKEIVQCNFHRGEGDTGDLTPRVRNVELRNITVQKARNVLHVRGYERSPVQDLRLVDCRFDGIEAPSTIEHAEVHLDNVTVNGHPVSKAAELL